MNEVLIEAPAALTRDDKNDATKVPRPDDTKTTVVDNASGTKRKAEFEDSSAKCDASLTADAEASDFNPGMSKVKRERRLAMNRSSARARRKRKKVLLDSLANQVSELTKRHDSLELTNSTLQARIQQLQSSLVQAQATITTLLNGQQHPSSAAVAPDLFGISSMQAPTTVAHQQAVAAAAAAELSHGSLFLDMIQREQLQKKLADASMAAAATPSGLRGASESAKEKANSTVLDAVPPASEPQNPTLSQNQLHSLLLGQASGGSSPSWMFGRGNGFPGSSLS